MSNNKITILKQSLDKPKNQELVDSILSELDSLNVWPAEIAKTIKELLNATTVNQAWIEMKDNKVILDTIKLLLSMKWVKTWNTTQINLFNINKPGKDEPLQF